MIFIDILGFVLKLIPIVFVLAVLWYIVSAEDRNVFGMIKRNQLVFKKRILPLALAVVLFFGISFFAGSAEEALSCKVTVGLNYLESSSGLNPNKTKFTASELTDDGVMEKIIEYGGYDIDADTLKSGFTVRPVRVNESVSLDKPYVATEYSVMFSARNGLNSLKASEVMDFYETALKEWFTETYSRKTNILDLDFSELETADYLDINDILSTKAGEIEKYMLSMSHIAGAFVSSETGESFRTLYKKITNYENIALENYHSFIMQNGISKDRAQYIVKKNYQNLLLDKDYQKKLGMYETFLEVINMYERDMATIVLVPTRDKNGEFYMSRTKLGVDDFSKNAEDAATAAASYLGSIESNNNIIDVLGSHSDNDTLAEQAESMIDSLKVGLSEYAKLAKDTVLEYESKNSDGYVVVTDEEQSEILTAGLKTAAEKSLVLLVILVVFAALKPQKSRNMPGREKAL